MSYSKYVAITEEGKLLMSSQVGGIKLALCGYAFIEDYNGFIAQMEDVEELKTTTLEDLKNNTRLIVNDKSVKYVIDSDGRVLASNSTKETYNADIADLKNHLFPVTYKMCGETETDKGVIYGDYQVHINKGMLNIQDIDNCDVFFDGIAFFGQPYKETSDNNLDVDETQDIALFAICYLGGETASEKIQILSDMNEKLDFECDLRIGLTEDNYISDTMFYFDEEYPKWSNNFNLVNRATKDCADLVIGADNEVTQSQWGDAEGKGIYGTEKELFITDETLNTASQSMASPAKVHIMTKPRTDGYAQPQLMISTASKDGDYLNWAGAFLNFTSGSSAVEGHINTLLQIGTIAKDFEEPNYEIGSSYFWQYNGGYKTENSYVDSHGNFSTNIFYGNVLSGSNGGFYQGSYNNTITTSHWVNLFNSNRNTLNENGSCGMTLIESMDNKIAHNADKSILLLSYKNELGYNRDESSTAPDGGFYGLLEFSSNNKIDNSYETLLSHSNYNKLNDNQSTSLTESNYNTIYKNGGLIVFNSNNNTIHETYNLYVNAIQDCEIDHISIPTMISHSIGLNIKEFGGNGSIYYPKEQINSFDFVDYCKDTTIVHGGNNFYIGCQNSSFGEKSGSSLYQSTLLFNDNLTTDQGQGLLAINCNNSYIKNGGYRNTYFGRYLFADQGVRNFVLGLGNTIKEALSTYMFGSNLYWDATTNRGSGSGASTTNATLFGSGNINMPDALFVFGDGDSEYQRGGDNWTSAYDASGRHNLLDLRGAGKNQSYATMNLYNGGDKCNYIQFGCYNNDTFIKFREATNQCVPQYSDKTYLEIGDSNDSTFINMFNYSTGSQKNTLTLGDDSTGGNITLNDANGVQKIKLSTDSSGNASIIVGSSNGTLTELTADDLSIVKKSSEVITELEHSSVFVEFRYKSNWVTGDGLDKSSYADTDLITALCNLLANDKDDDSIYGYVFRNTQGSSKNLLRGKIVKGYIDNTTDNYILGLIWNDYGDEDSNGTHICNAISNYKGFYWVKKSDIANVTSSSTLSNISSYLHSLGDAFDSSSVSDVLIKQNFTELGINGWCSYIKNTTDFTIEVADSELTSWGDSFHNKMFIFLQPYNGLTSRNIDVSIYHNKDQNFSVALAVTNGSKSTNSHYINTFLSKFSIVSNNSNGQTMKQYILYKLRTFRTSTATDDNTASYMAWLGYEGEYEKQNNDWNAYAKSDVD